MTTLLVAFLWGLGTSTGAGIGLLAYAALKASIDSCTGAGVAYQSTVETNNRSTAALVRRNELGLQEVETLERIAAALERTAFGTPD